MDYNEAKFEEYRIQLGLEETFSPMDLTKKFIELKANATDEELDEIADAYEYLRKNNRYRKKILRKKEENKADDIDPTIFPQINEFRTQQSMSVVYPIFEEPTEIVTIIDAQRGIIPVVAVDAEEGDRVSVFFDNRLYSTLASKVKVN